MTMLLFLLTACLFAQIFAVDNEVTFTRSMTLGPNAEGVIFWAPGVKDDDYITFELHSKSKGWSGVGLSPRGAMHDSDIVVMWIDEQNQYHISDRHGPTDTQHGYPPEDAHQDYEKISAEKNGTYQIFRYQRKMLTRDVFDWNVTADTVRMLFAYNDILPVSVNDFQPHTAHYTQSTRLIGMDDTERVRRAFNAPGVFPYDLSAGGVRLPNNNDTLYYCKMFQLKKFPQSLQLIGFEMLVEPGNLPYVHHVLLMGCKDKKNMSDWMDKSQDCYADSALPMMQACGDTFGVWAIGGEPFAYPDNMGMQYYGETYDYMVAEFHYDNSNKIQNVIDNSTFRLYLTNTTRPVQLAKLNLMTDTNAFEQIIPPDQESFAQYVYCPASCTSKMDPGENMTVVAGFLHSHLAGTAMTIRHLRNGKELEPIVQDLYYDFNYQTLFNLADNPKVIMPGDELIFECLYNTKGRTKTTLGGLSTHEEMCFAMLDFYPMRQFLRERCRSDINLLPLIPKLGAELHLPEKPDPDYNPEPNNVWVTDAKGQNRTYLEWITNYKWTNDTVAILQNYIKLNPQYIGCEIQPAKSVNYTFDFYLADPCNVNLGVPCPLPPETSTTTTNRNAFISISTIMLVLILSLLT